MPSSDWEDSFYCNLYAKKLIINSQDTMDCVNGCYLLISIQNYQLGDYVDDNIFSPFLIITKIIHSNNAPQKIVIHVDEIIIGNVDVSLTSNKIINELYELLLPQDSDVVEFDWQSSVAGLYINLGGIIPTAQNADFKLLPPGKNTILSLSKVEILKRVKEKKIRIPNENSLRDINLVIGIWTDKSDSIDTELYALRMHQPIFSVDSLDIFEVNSDQKIMCNPKNVNSGEYRCLFMVTYNNYDTYPFTPLIV